jgi:hypothetical protein
MKLRFFLLFLPKLERLSTLYFSDPPHIYFDFLFSVWFTSNFLKFFYTNNNWTSFIIVWTRSRMIFLSPLISTFHHSPTAAIFFDFRWNSYYVQMGWSDPQRFASSSITHGTNVVHLFHVSLNVPSNLFFCCTVLLSYRTFARGVILCVLLVDYQLRENRRSVLFFSSYSIFVQFPFFCRRIIIVMWTT